MTKMHSVSSGKTFVTGQCEIVVVSPLQMSPPVIITPPVDCPQQLRFLLLFERKVARVRSKLKQTKCTRMARNLPERNGYRFIGSSSLHIHENQLASRRSVHMPAPVGEVAIFASVKLSSCPHCKCRRPSSSPHLLTVRNNYAFCCCLKGRSRECDRSSSKPNALEWPETSRKGMATDL